MPRWVQVASAEEVPPGRVIRVAVGTGHLAICNHDGKLYAVQDRCPHAGAPLGHGRLRDGRLVCPRHFWKWDLQTGEADLTTPHRRVRRYACRVKDGEVYVDVSRPLPESSGEPETGSGQ